jgi:hypothetical protein
VYTSERVIENETGLTLNAVVNLVADKFAENLKGWRDECHAIEMTVVRHGSRARRDTAVAFPTREDYDRHIAKYWKITRIWKRAVAEVDEIIANAES